jgi:hypothetical protein
MNVALEAVKQVPMHKCAKVIFREKWKKWIYIKRGFAKSMFFWRCEKNVKNVKNTKKRQKVVKKWPNQVNR